MALHWLGVDHEKTRHSLNATLVTAPISLGAVMAPTAAGYRGKHHLACQSLRCPTSIGGAREAGPVSVAPPMLSSAELLVTVLAALRPPELNLCCCNKVECMILELTCIGCNRRRGPVGNGMPAALAKTAGVDQIASLDNEGRDLGTT